MDVGGGILVVTALFLRGGGDSQNCPRYRSFSNNRVFNHTNTR